VPHQRHDEAVQRISECTMSFHITAAMPWRATLRASRHMKLGRLETIGRVPITS
jgi:hypothetical protein